MLRPDRHRAPSGLAPRPIGLGWGPHVGTLPRKAGLPEQYAVFSAWGAPIAGPYLSRDEAQVGLILKLEE